MPEFYDELLTSRVASVRSDLAVAKSPIRNICADVRLAISLGGRGGIAYENGKQYARYIDPRVEFKALRPPPEHPLFEYGNFDERLDCIESQYEVPAVPSTIRDTIYDDIGNGIPCLETFEHVVRGSGARAGGSVPAERFSDRFNHFGNKVVAFYRT